MQIEAKKVGITILMLPDAKSTCPMRREGETTPKCWNLEREGFIAEPYTEMSGLFLEKS